MKKLTTYYFINIIGAVVSAIIIISYLWIQNEYNHFEKDIQIIKTSYLQEQKKLLKSEVKYLKNAIEAEIKKASGDKEKLKQIQKKFIDLVRYIRFGKDNYVVIINSKGDIIIHPLMPELKNIYNLKDRNGKYFVQEAIEMVKKGDNHFVYYDWQHPVSKKIARKFAWVEYIPQFDWLIISGMYVQNIDAIIKQKEAVFQQEVKRNIKNIVLTSLLVLLIVIFIIYIQTKKIEKNFRLFDRFMKKAHLLTNEIDTTKLDFEEFHTLALLTNEMVQKRKEIISKLHTNNQKLGETVRTFEAIFNLAMEFMVITKDGIIKDLNDTTYKSLGYDSKQEVLGKSMFEFIDPKYHDIIKEHYHKNNYDPYAVELLKKDKKSSILVYVKGTDIIKDSQTMRLATMLDMSLLTQRDKALADSKAKSEFLANMSHEIRTPLNAIMGFLDLLKAEIKTQPKALEYIQIIQASSESLLEIINDILDFSKIESGKLEIEKKNFHFQNEIGNLVKLFEARAKQKDILLVACYEDSLPTYINTDPFRLKQIIANLLSNAIKFSKPKSMIKINFDYKDGMLEVYVQDEGKGIEEDKLEHIFKPFSQEDSSTTRNYGGTGLGLSICHKLVTLLKGSIGVTSKLNKGSKFYFSIPIEVVDTALYEDIDLTNKEIKFPNKKILIVEDNKANQMFIQILLKQYECSIDIANDGVEAVEKFKNDHFDLILMDENMPNLSGSDATKEIRKIEQQNNLPHTPIVALTANAIKGDKEKFLKAGMDEYLTKPLNKSQLIMILRRFFEKQ